MKMRHLGRTFINQRHFTGDNNDNDNNNNNNNNIKKSNNSR